MYYQNKIGTLKDIFGAKEIRLEPGCLISGERRYPIIDDVIVLSDEGHYTSFVKDRLSGKNSSLNKGGNEEFAEDIQFTFGEEWKNYSEVLAEHEKEFRLYFDIVDIKSLSGKRICDLGCGMGRWSYFLKDRCREIVLFDFSDAIFVARKNLSGNDNCLFFMGDLRKMPFRDDFADFIFSLGVLHHLPTPCLDEVRNLRRYAPQSLVFLYYALDNRPLHFRLILRLVTMIRSLVSRIRSPFFRKLFSFSGTYGLYLPLVFLGFLLRPFRLSKYVPLYDFYHDKRPSRIEQDVYDRFFTRIEQRVTRAEIRGVMDTFSEVIISDRLPYWHFLCKR